MNNYPETKPMLETLHETAILAMIEQFGFKAAIPAILTYLISDIEKPMTLESPKKLCKVIREIFKERGYVI